MLGIIGAGISALGSACSAILSTCTAIGGAVISTGRVMIDAINTGLQTIDRVCDVALAVGKELGLFSPEQNEKDLYELGMRAEYSLEEGITSEEFESNQAYIDHIREKIELRKDSFEKLENLSDEEKLKYASIGSAMTIAAIKEKYEVDIPGTFWTVGADLGVAPKQFKPILDVFEDAKIDPDLDGYLKGTLTSELQRDIYDLIDNKLDAILDSETIDKLLS